MHNPRLFSPSAQWLWDSSNRKGYNYYLQARRSFQHTEETSSAQLLITADAYYQAWLNGKPIGHGPAKSAQGTRSVDCYEIVHLLKNGTNQLEILVLSVGVGTMNYCLGEAGFIFELRIGTQCIVSDESTQVRKDMYRTHPTVRRWVMPCLEYIEANTSPADWTSAKVVPGTKKLYPRRVPLPLRDAVVTQRLVHQDRVSLPNFSVSFRVKPALVDGPQALQSERFATPATLRLTLISECEQTLRLTPTLGAVTWKHEEKTVFDGSGWELWKTEESEPCVQLKKGRNVLVGRHKQNFFEDISLCGFSAYTVAAEELIIERDDGKACTVQPWHNANPYDLALAAEATEQGGIARNIWDLGAVHTGWIAFEAEGPADSSLLLAFVEAIEPGNPSRIQWPSGCNNALLYRLGPGPNTFESFLPYGVRYIIVHEIEAPVELKNLRLLKASCASITERCFESDDALLNDIYKIAAQTVESGTDDTFTDCPTFEQVNWNFDNRLASAAAMWFGDNRDIIRNSIWLFAEDPFRTGLVNSQTPSEWRRDPIPNWAFHWVQWCWDYYWQTADQAFVKQIFPAVRESMDDALGRIDCQGLFSWPDVWHFLEWGHGRDDDHAVNTSEQAGLYLALQKAIGLAKIAEEPFDNYETAAAQLKAAVNQHLWDPNRLAYADSLHADGTLSAVTSQATNAYVAVSGIAPDEWSRALAHDLAQGTCPLLRFGSPYGLFYIMELWDQYRHVDAIFAQIRERWGDMVHAGDGTTWEHFKEFGHGDWPTRSRCHPFSTYIVKYYAKYLLGIEATKPGLVGLRVRGAS